MGTEVLRPQDCLIERIRVAPQVLLRRKGGYGGYAKPNRRVDQKKRVNQNDGAVSAASKRSSSDYIKAPKSSDNLVMGRGTILRRVESRDSKEMIASGTERIGSDPVMIPKQKGTTDQSSAFSSPQPKKSVWPDMYAGSAFSMSPAPSSLPLPTFYKKTEASAAGDAVDASATRDLRRLLRLD